MRKLAVLFILPALALAIYDMDTFDLNHWTSPFYNWGIYGLDNTICTGQAGGAWPRPLHNCYIFGAGTWLGAIAVSRPETLCTVFYNPLTGGGEGFPTLCRYWREGTGDIRDHFYKHPGDWPPSHSRFPMAPLEPLSDMDMWCAYCDSDPSSHDTLGRPLGVDIYQIEYGFSDSLAQDFFFVKYEIANCSGDSIRQAIFGPAIDPDIGSSTDDMADVILDHVFVVGQDTIRVRNLAFAYDYDNYENPSFTWDSGTPGAVAVALLAAPDSLGLTAFKRFTLDIVPPNDVAQYMSLAGFNYRSGEYEPYDSTDLQPADKEFVLASGPFNLAPDSTATFWYVVIGSPFGEQGQTPSQRDTSDLALRYKWALEFWPRLLPGIEETPSAEVRTPNGVATVVRSVLFLPTSPFAIHSSLFDMTGRKVMGLRPGPNDVSSLTPGVYFVRSGPSAVSRKPSAVQKVVITR